MIFDTLARSSIGIRMLAAAGILALGACASTPASRFYTLAPSAQAGSAMRATSLAAPVEIRSVTVPAQVARNQLVVRRNESEVDLLENERWASPLGDEIRTALSIAMTQQLARVDDRRARQTGDVPAYWISVDVQRFESWPDSRVMIDTTWRIRTPADSEDRLTCRSTVIEPVAPGYDALVDGHRRALVAIAAQMAAGVRALAATTSGERPAATMRSAHAAPALHCPSAAAADPLPAPQASMSRATGSESAS